MLRELTGGSTEQAAAALTQTDGRVKLAVLVVRGLPMTEAEALLREHDGDLRQAEATLAGHGAAPRPR